jgi:hypothetical protein
MLFNPNNAAENSYMSIDELTRDVCLYLGDPEAKYYMQTSRFVIQAIREINLSFIPTVKTISLTIGENMTSPAPLDLDVIIKIGVCCPNGELRIILNNDNLCLPDLETVDCCDCPPKDNLKPSCQKDNHTHSCKKCTFHNLQDGIHNSLGVFTHRHLYGYTAKNNNGWYRYDLSTGRIVFGSGCDVQVGSLVVMEYKSSASIAELQLVPRKAYQSIAHHVGWKFKMESGRLNASYQNYTIQDVIYQLRSGYHSTVKR